MIVDFRSDLFFNVIITLLTGDHGQPKGCPHPKHLGRLILKVLLHPLVLPFLKDLNRREVIVCLADHFRGLRFLCLLGSLATHFTYSFGHVCCLRRFFQFNLLGVNGEIIILIEHLDILRLRNLIARVTAVAFEGGGISHRSDLLHALIVFHFFDYFGHDQTLRIVAPCCLYITHTLTGKNKASEGGLPSQAVFIDRGSVDVEEAAFHSIVSRGILGQFGARFTMVKFHRLCFYSGCELGSLDFGLLQNRHLFLKL